MAVWLIEEAVGGHQDFVAGVQGPRPGHPRRQAVLIHAQPVSTDLVAFGPPRRGLSDDDRAAASRRDRQVPRLGEPAQCRLDEKVIGQDRGELPADTDLELAVEAVTGAAILRVYFLSTDQSVKAMRRLFVVQLRGLGARGY